MTSSGARIHVRARRFLVACALAGLAVAGYATPLTGKVVAVSDGDTITVLDAEHQQHRVRVAWIDAPEKGMAFGARAKENLSRLVYGRDVRCEAHSTDVYGRTVATVLVDGTDVALLQLRDGLAWHFTRYAREQPRQQREVYERAEQSARIARRGLWQDAAPVPPWEWRREHREGGKQRASAAP